MKSNAIIFIFNAYAIRKLFAMNDALKIWGYKESTIISALNRFTLKLASELICQPLLKFCEGRNLH